MDKENARTAALAPTGADPEAAVAPLPTLQPLTCAACRGPVPLVDGDATKCPYCGQPVEIPPEHRALRDADRQARGDAASLDDIYARIGKPPGLLLRAWGSAVGQVVIAIVKVLGVLGWIWVFLISLVFRALSDLDDIRILLAVLALPFGALFAVVWGLARGMHALSSSLGVDVVDVYSLPSAFAVLGVLIYLTLPLPLALFRAAEAFAKLRQRLQACLAAKPSKTPGGPSTCRQCGAALSVAPGALGVRCLYCRADNLVALPSRWVTRVRDKTATFHHQVESALEEERQSRGAARSTMRWILVGSLALPIVLGGLGVAMARFRLIENQDGWAARVTEEPRALLPHRCTILDDCTGDYPSTFDVAVRRGETIEVDGPADVAANLMVRQMDSGRYLDLPDEIPGGEFKARWTARASGWMVVFGPALDRGFTVGTKPPPRRHPGRTRSP